MQLVAKIFHAFQTHLLKHRATMEFGLALEHLNPHFVQGKQDFMTSSQLSFGIVHFNAPNYLLLNIRNIRRFHKEAKIYILDNGSKAENLTAVMRGTGGIKKLYLWGATPIKSDHSVGMQFLLNLSALANDVNLIFLDQDCILARPVHELLYLLSDNVLLVGARDLLMIPKDCGPLEAGKSLRAAQDLIHGSFMIMQPVLIKKRFGAHSLFCPPRKTSWQHEPYHGISYRCHGKIIYLEMAIHDQSIPLLTSYSYKGKIFAFHSWYSSRTFSLCGETIDGLQIEWLGEVGKRAFSYLNSL